MTQEIFARHAFISTLLLNVIFGITILDMVQVGQSKSNVSIVRGKFWAVLTHVYHVFFASSIPNTCKICSFLAISFPTTTNSFHWRSKIFSHVGSRNEHPEAFIQHSNHAQCSLFFYHLSIWKTISTINSTTTTCHFSESDVLRIQVLFTNNLSLVEAIKKMLPKIAVVWKPTLLLKTQ